MFFDHFLYGGEMVVEWIADTCLVGVSVEPSVVLTRSLLQICCRHGTKQKEQWCMPIKIEQKLHLEMFQNAIKGPFKTKPKVGQIQVTEYESSLSRNRYQDFN